jgi:hypothetical protein
VGIRQLRTRLDQRQRRRSRVLHISGADNLGNTMPDALDRFAAPRTRRPAECPESRFPPEDRGQPRHKCCGQRASGRPGWSCGGPPRADPFPGRYQSREHQLDLAAGGVVQGDPLDWPRLPRGHALARTVGPDLCSTQETVGAGYRRLEAAARCAVRALGGTALEYRL